MAVAPTFNPPAFVGGAASAGSPIQLGTGGSVSDHLAGVTERRTEDAKVAGFNAGQPERLDAFRGRVDRGSGHTGHKWWLHGGVWVSSYHWAPPGVSNDFGMIGNFTAGSSLPLAGPAYGSSAGALAADGGQALPALVGPGAAALPDESALDDEAVPADQAAEVEVVLPDPQAAVWFDDQEMSQRGLTRRFSTPPLPQGHVYRYAVTARWEQDGRQVTSRRVIEVRAGGVTVVDFRPGAAADSRNARPRSTQ